MDAEAKKIWLDALRSGKYKQSKKSLRDGKGFCCLGVLADAHKGDRWTGNGITGYYYNFQDGKGGCYWFGCLARDYLHEIGLTDHEQINLAEMNDNGKTFAEIADYIEQNH